MIEMKKKNEKSRPHRQKKIVQPSKKEIEQPTSVEAENSKNQNDELSAYAYRW